MHIPARSVRIARSNVGAVTFSVSWATAPPLAEAFPGSLRAFLSVQAVRRARVAHRVPAARRAREDQPPRVEPRQPVERAALAAPRATLAALARAASRSARTTQPAPVALTQNRWDAALTRIIRPLSHACAALRRGVRPCRVARLRHYRQGSLRPYRRTSKARSLHLKFNSIPHPTVAGCASAVIANAPHRQRNSSAARR